MSAMASQITGVSTVYSSLCPGADQRKHQNSASLAFVRGIHPWPVNSTHKGPVARKMFPFDDVIIIFTCGSVVPSYIGSARLWPHHSPCCLARLTRPSRSEMEHSFVQWCAHQRHNPYSGYYILEKNFACPYTKCIWQIHLWPLIHPQPEPKLDAILSTTFSNAFLWMKASVFKFKFHWSLFLMVLLTIRQHWFR